MVDTAAELRLDVEGPVARVTLTRPERRNALTFATWQALTEVGGALPDDVRIVVVRGDGPSFCDLRAFQEGASDEGSFAELARLDEEALDERVAAAQSAYTWLRRPEIVSVAAVQGHAIGAGFQLALACDLRVMADDVQLCMKEPSLGLVPDLGGTKNLVDTVGTGRAIEICLTGRRIGAVEARELGLAQLVVERAELDASVRDLTAALLVTPRDAAAATKELLQAASRRTLEEQLVAERRAQVGRLRALFGH
ncbi:MAG: enoyl-CoA hydratase/isomerase family protein [Streptosporangiales bacterium]|nr:enoyl-CoA hydratase/isomerase family protein [Streptosporangiales bacterium]